MRGKRFDEMSQKYMQECQICLKSYTKEDKVAEIRCGMKHIFHYKCAEAWLTKNQKCPLCDSKVKVNP